MIINTNEAPKFSIKSVLLIALYAIILTLVIMWYFKGSKYKAENIALKNDISNIQKQRDSLASERDSLKANYANLSKTNDQLYQQYHAADSESVKLQQQLNLSLNSLNKLTTNMNAVNKNINYVELHPVKRQGDDLLNSLNKINN